VRLPGYCIECRKFKQVQVSGSALHKVAMGRTPEGICAQCQEEGR
jgi:hypothetical protein